MSSSFWVKAAGVIGDAQTTKAQCPIPQQQTKGKGLHLQVPGRESNPWMLQASPIHREYETADIDWSTIV